MHSERATALALADSRVHAAPPVRNELMDRLDAALRERAKAMVDEALAPAEKEACNVIAKALEGIASGSFRALIAGQMMESVHRVRLEAYTRQYETLLAGALAHFAPDAAAA